MEQIDKVIAWVEISQLQLVSNGQKLSSEFCFGKILLKKTVIE